MGRNYSVVRELRSLCWEKRKQKVRQELGLVGLTLISTSYPTLLVGLVLGECDRDRVIGWDCDYRLSRYLSANVFGGKT